MEQDEIPEALKKYEAFIQDSKGYLDLENDEKNIKAVILKRLIQQTEAMIASLENSPKRLRGMIPIDDWTPWLWDVARNIAKVDWGRRDFMVNNQALVWDKLWADQGAGLQEAYQALGKSLVKVVNITDPETQAKELARLLQLPAWIWENPRIARDLLGNIYSALQVLKTEPQQYGSIGSMAQNIVERVTFDKWVEYVIEGNFRTRHQSMSKEGLALLHLSYHIPTIIGAAQGSPNSALGGFLSAFVGPAGQKMGDTVMGATKAAVATAMGGFLSESLPKEWVALAGSVQSVLNGSNPQNEAQVLVARSIASELVTFARDLELREVNGKKIGGVKFALSEIKENFKSWWRHSSWGEKVTRITTQYILPVAGVAAGVLATVGLIAGTVATGGLLGVIVGAMAFGLMARTANEHAIFKRTTDKVLEDRARRDRNRRYIDDQTYLTGLLMRPNLVEQPS
ncbi:MAG: hypothetical protein WCK49_08400 [Myxococcaceae bacterium]